MKQGGKREGAGRPPKLEKQLALAKETIKDLQVLVRGGLYRAATNYELLIEEELETAFTDDDSKLRMQARHYLLDLISKAVKIHDIEETAISGLIRKWTYEERGGAVGEPGAGDIETPGLNSVPTRTGGSVLPKLAD